MENILRSLLINDNNIISQGTTELRNALKNPEALGALCNVLATSNESQLRQYAAVILRKRFNKSTNWTSLPATARKELKSALLKLLVDEPEKTVKNSIAQLMATILKHEPPSDMWPELLQFIQQTTTSQNSDEQELGFYTLSILTDVAGTQFFHHTGSFMQLFSLTLSNLQDKSSPIGYFIIKIMINLGPAARSSRELTNMYIETLPKVSDCIKALAIKRPDRASESLDLFYDFAEKDGMAFLVSRIKQIIGLCLEFVQDTKYNLDLQIKALSFIGIVIRLKTQILAKEDTLLPIISILFKILSCRPEKEDEEEYFSTDPEEDTLLTSACETLDVMALNFDADRLMPVLVKFMEEAMKGDVYNRKAVYLCMGIVSQGCSAYIRKNMLKHVIECVFSGITQNEPVLRNAALFALGQFAEHLQPEISEYASELMPILLNLISELGERGKTGDQMGQRGDRVMYALERFCENLEDGIVPLLPELMSRLLPLCAPPYHTHLRMLALSNIATVAAEAKEHIMPYFSVIMNQLNTYLTDESLENSVLRVESLDTLGVLAKSVGASNFEPLAIDTINLGMQLVSNTEDPDIKKSSYGLFAAVSSVMKENIAPYLPAIIPHMLNSLKSDEGYVSSKSSFPSVYDGASATEDEEDIDKESNASSDDLGLDLENDYIEEKEESCFALKEIAQNTGTVFLPYLNTSFEETFKLLSFPSGDVRKAAVDAVFQFCSNYAKIPAEQDFIMATDKTISKSALLIRMDEDRDVVLTVLENIEGMLKEVGPRIICRRMLLDGIVACVRNILAVRTEAQGWGEDELEGLVDPDEELIDAAIDIIPALGKAMTPETFSPEFNELLPLFNQRLSDCSDTSKGNMIGTLAESFGSLGPFISEHLSVLFPYFLAHSKDKDPNIRNNSIYGLGQMVLHGKEVLFPHYPEILVALSRVFPDEKLGNVLDNACSVVARLIITNADAVPLSQVVPVLIEHLPLRDDFDENKWVFRAIAHLYSMGCNELKQNIVGVIRAAGISLHSHNVDNETKDLIIELLKRCRQDFPAECSQMDQFLPKEAIETINKAFC